MLKVMLTTLSLLFTIVLTGCEKDYDLLAEVCPAAECQGTQDLVAKSYELRIGNRVIYQKAGSSAFVHTKGDGKIVLKGVDTTTIKPGQGLDSLTRKLNLFLVGTYTVIESNGLEEAVITKSINTTATTDEKGLFYFQITHVTEPGKVITEVKDLEFKIFADVAGSRMASTIDYSDGSLWSKALGFFEAFATYDITSGKYDCSADQCTWIDLGGDLTFYKE